MRLVILVGLLLSLVACSHKEPPPERRITPGARIIYNSGVGDTVWVVCDKGNLIYMTEKSPSMAVVPGGCPSGQP
jgi:hypothetical protein